MLYAFLRDVADLVVIERRSDGSGLVELPILSAGTIDLARTATAAEGLLTFTRDDLRAMAANFAQYPGPVPAGFRDHSEDRSGAQPAFIEAMRVEGDALYATFDLNAWAFDQVVTQRSYRGFSIEGAKNLQKPTAKFEGWTVTGGLFTNQPAANVEYRVAATTNDAAEELVTISFALAGRKGDDMPDPKTDIMLEEAQAQVALEKRRAEDATAERDAANAKLKAATDKAERADAELGHANAKVRRLEARVGEQDDTIARLTAERDAAKKASDEAALSILDGQVRDRMARAIDAGVSPALFEPAQKDAAGWFNGSFKSLEAFDAFLAALPKTEPPTIPSGRRKPDANRSAVPQAEQDRLDNIGLSDSGLDDVTNARQLARLRAQKANS